MSEDKFREIVESFASTEHNMTMDVLLDKCAVPYRKRYCL